MGPFIVFEGGEGSGKSTQVKLLAERFVLAGRGVVSTREPGGSVGAEEIRKLLVEGEPDRWSPLTEALLFAAARNDHIEKTITPAREREFVVISDRYYLSSLVYQGFVRQLGTGKVKQIHPMLDESTMPDLTIVLDVDPVIGLERAVSRGIQNRFERFPLEFHQQIRSAYQYMTLTRTNTAMICVDRMTRDEVASMVWDMVIQAGLHNG